LAVRLQLKLGLVAEQDRLPDSPDTSVIVEPSSGSIARSKGNLYLLVTSRQPGARARDAARLAADTIRNEYYYDESTGIRGSLIKAIGLANKRLAHQRDRFNLGHQSDGAGPIGVAVSVVRGHELYAATVGPAEAYLIRQARLSTLPDPHRERGLPVAQLEPNVWRGEINVGDSVILVSANLVARLGTDELKDALVTLHPQSAIDHLHERFVTADGRGSDGAIAFEATEQAITPRLKTVVPVRAAEEAPGAADRSPVPLADSVTGGVAAIGAGATRARTAAGGIFERAVLRFQDILPRRRVGHRRVTPLSDRRETQRRAAIAVLAFVIVAAGLGVGVYAFGEGRTPVAGAIQSVTAGQQAITDVEQALARVNGPGIDLVATKPGDALPLLTTAYQKLGVAEANNVPHATVQPLRDRTVSLLDRLYHVVPVHSTTVYTFPANANPAANLSAIVRGPDGAAYVIDRGSKAVWRIDLATKRASTIIKNGEREGTARVATPRFLVVGGPQVVAVDSKNALWRWTPADNRGRGALARIRIPDAGGWGDDVKAVATFVANFNSGLFKIYVVDPSAQQILTYSPSFDGSGFPQVGQPRLPAGRPMDNVTDLLIDGDIYVVDNGDIDRLIPGGTWTAKPPADTMLRPAPKFAHISSGTDKGTGNLYAFDSANGRIVAIAKSDGHFVEQYRPAPGEASWADLRSFLVIPGAGDDVPATLWWVDKNAFHSAILQGSEQSAASASPSSSPGGSRAPSASARASSAASTSPAPSR